MAPKPIETGVAMENSKDFGVGKTVDKKRSSIFAARDGHSLEFDNIFLSTKSKNPEKNPPKEILKGISGSFPAKSLSAIMGPSGSGKTSLLKVLTGRVGNSSSLNLSSEIQLDGKLANPRDNEVRKHFAYVEQDISIPASCTPREAITFSARLRLDKKTSDEDINNMVDDILENLGLQECADTFIGGGAFMKGGLSGGEKKRVQCGIELVTNPEIVLLDEPTSGLDSYSAQSLIDVLKKIADAGATVIVSIHQPPPPVVRKIDNLVLMTSGKIVYEGPMELAVEQKFTEKGFPKPDDYNIADWILQVVQTNSIEELEKLKFYGGKSKLDNRKLAKNSANAATESPSFEPVGFGVQTKLLVQREMKKLVRDKLEFVVKISTSTIFGLLFGCIFFQIGNNSYEDNAEVMGSLGAIANLLIGVMFGIGGSSLREFPIDRPIFLREYSTNHYSILPYFFAKFSRECFEVSVQVLMQLVVGFFMMGFQMNFFYFFALNFVLAIASNGIGIFVGSFTEDPNVAQEMFPALVVPQLLFSGFFIQSSLIPGFIRWAQYLCTLTYAIRLSSLYEFGDCETQACESLLSNNGVDELEAYWYWIILIGVGALFRIAALSVLKAKATFK